MMPIDLFEIQLVLAILSTSILFFVKDSNNYIDIISGVACTIFWWTSGLSLLTGVQTETATFTGSWMMWILVGIGMVCALVTITKIIDVLDKKNHISMDFDHRV